MSKIANILPFLIGHADYVPIALRTIRELRKDRSGMTDYQSYPEIGNPFTQRSEKEDLLGRANWLLEKSSYMLIGGENRYGELYKHVCDMLVTLIALKNYGKLYQENTYSNQIER